MRSQKSAVFWDCISVMRCFVALEILVDTNTCSICVEQKPVVAGLGLGFSWPVILADMTVTCSWILVETLTAPEYICALSSFSEDSWASAFQRPWCIQLICFTVVSLLLQQQMAPRKLCWMLSLCLCYLVHVALCWNVAFFSQGSPAWLRTAYFGHQKTLFFHCCLVKSWKTNTGATSSGTMWRYCLFHS